MLFVKDIDLNYDGTSMFGRCSVLLLIRVSLANHLQNILPESIGRVNCNDHDVMCQL